MPADDDELPAGELPNVVECAVCGRRAQARPVDPTSKVLPAFQAKPEGWRVRLANPPRLLCSEECSRRLT